MQKSLRTERERSNTISSQLRSAPSKEEKLKLVEEARLLKIKINAVEGKEEELDTEMKNLAASLPNVTSEHTPLGDEPAVIEYLNPHLAPEDIMNPPKDRPSHLQIGAELKLLDFSDAGQVSGWGWYYLLNEAVLLEQALISYAFSLASKRGWKLVSPPSMVYAHMAAACGFQPRDQGGEQQIYKVEGGKHVMAGTAEIPLAGMNAGKVLPVEKLPMKVVGVGRAYRAEAGARGADSKGLYRVHEFTKVELFAWAPGREYFEDANGGKRVVKEELEEEGVEVEESASTSQAFANGSGVQAAEDVFDEMLEMQKEFLSSLGLYARVLEMPATDLGASAARKIDIEAYMPSRAAKDPWGEVSSLSNCTDYQSRRLNTRMKGLDAKTNNFPYTLNGTACAVPRVLISILENGWDEARQGVVVPEVLRPYMGGMEFIGKKK